jgi:hypothetical protein
MDGQAQFLVLQLPDLVAQPACFLEFEVGGGLAHLLFQFLDIGAQIVADHVRTVLVDRHGHLIAAGDMRDDVADLAADRLRRDAMFGIIGHLLLAAPRRLGHGAPSIR